MPRSSNDNGARWVLLATIASRLGLTTRALRHWCVAGRVPADKRGGGRWWIDLAALRRRLALDGEGAVLEDLAELVGRR